MYLIHDEYETLHVRRIPQKDGSMLYSVDQRLNPQTIGIKPGGVYGDGIVVSGQLGIRTGHTASDEIAHLLFKVLRKQFKKVKSFYVGAHALSLLDSGSRLTINSEASREYDLVR
jgi:hypothetical protein